jgi:hypothetical protein
VREINVPLGIEWIKERISNDEYFLSSHADQERMEEPLRISEIEEALKRSTILEQYKDTGRGESCLVVGFTDQGKPIHAVCGRRGKHLAIVTTYIPKPPKFKNPYERG